MSKGSDKHKARLNELNSFGKNLARRCKSHCELCDSHGTKLVIHEIPPELKEPDFDHCIFICETCQEQINNPKRLDTNHWFCLHTCIWSEIPAVQVMAVLMAKRVAKKVDFAEELLDQVYLENDITQWVEEVLKDS